MYALSLYGCGDEAGGATSGSSSCVRHSDCPTLSDRCVNGACQPECISDRDCDDEGVCVEGACEASAPTCRADADCAYGAACVQGLCELIPGYCERNSDCASGSECVRETNRCSDAGSCRDATDCFAGERCVDAVCQQPQAADAGMDADATEDTGMDADDEDSSADVPADTIEDTAPDTIEDTAPDTVEDTTLDTLDDTTPDTVEDTAPDTVEDTAPDTVEDTAPDTTEDTTPDTDGGIGGPTTPERGSYVYQRVPVGGLASAVRVAFHPSGEYALIAERYNVVHVYDWVTQTATRYDIPNTGGFNYFDDLEFDPSGDFALIVGWNTNSGEEGRIFRFNDAAYRADEGVDTVFVEQTAARRGERYTGIQSPWAGGLPRVLSRDERGDIAKIRDFDPATGDFTDFIKTTNTGGGCEDLAFVNNEWGDSGTLIVCGYNGATIHYYTEVGDVGEWRTSFDTGNTNFSNPYSVAAHNGGDYALMLGGRRIYRFEEALLNDTADAASFSRLGIWNIEFQQDGRRALIVGRTGLQPIRGNVIEYRHDEYACDGLSCELTEVPIPNFDAAPYNDSSARVNLEHSAFRPGCDGGLIVGGATSGNAMVIEFQIEGQRPCR